MHHPSPEMILLLAWIAMTGGAIGSFLNVVVYRMPAGMSLLYPRSHCPRCSHPLRWYDNVPVLGWILLGGRCRDCRGPISARYPLIEATTMAMFVVLAVCQWVVPQGVLPLRSYPVAGGFVTPPLSLIETAGIYVYHLFLLCTLLSVALIEYDGKRLPWSLGVPALVVGVTAGCLWPHLHPVAAVARLDGWAAGMADGMAGLAAGLLVSGIGMVRARRGAMMASALTGLFLGWQAAVVLAVVCVAVHGAWTGLRRLAPRIVSLPLSVWWVMGAMTWIVEWRWILRWWSAAVGF